MSRPLLALLLALFAGGVAGAPVRLLLPAYVESTLHQPPLLTSVLLSIQLGCGGLFALAGGALSDLVSRRAAVLVGLTTALFGASMFALQAPAALVAVAVLWGIAGGFQSAGGQTFMMNAVSRAQLGTATAAYFITSTASGAAGAAIAGWAVDVSGYRPVVLGAAALSLTAVVLAARFLPPLGSDGGRPAAGAAASWSVSGYRDLLSRPDVVDLCALRYFPTVAWGAASLAIPLLLFRHSDSNSTVGLYGTVSLLAASGAQFLTGREIDRRASSGGARGGGAASSLVTPLALAILACAVGATLGASSAPALFVCGTAWAMSAWALSTTMPSLIHASGQGRDDGRLVALTHLMWSAGMLSGTLAAGLVVDRHAAAPFALAALCLAVTAAVGARFARRPAITLSEAT